MRNNEHANYGTPLWVIGHKLIAIKTTGNYAFADVWVTPEVPGPPPHYHAEAVELYYVLEGTVEFMRGNRWYALRAGQRLEIPKGTLHTFRNPTDTPARFTTIHDPGAGADALFLTFGIPADEPNSFERSIAEEHIARFAAATAQNDMIIAERPKPAQSTRIP